MNYEEILKSRSKGGKNKWAKMSKEQRTKHVKMMSDAAKRAINKAKKEYNKKKIESVDN